jgi:hypothetical protein
MAFGNHLLKHFQGSLHIYARKREFSVDSSVPFLNHKADRCRCVSADCNLKVRAPEGRQVNMLVSGPGPRVKI